MDPDLVIREAAFRHCRELVERWGESIPASEIGRGMVVDGERILLVAWGRGVFKPRQLTDGPLTLVSSLASSYDDEHLDGDIMLYDYAPESTDEWANEGLKRIATLGRHVILLKQVNESPSEYLVFAPVAVLDVDERARKFRLGLAPATTLQNIAAPSPSRFSRAYAPTLSMARLHQAHFRRSVMLAYGVRCCICRLRERALLEAAHIIPDRLPEGVPIVRNGMAMCPTHHRAFDRGIVDIAESFRIRVRRERLSRLDEESTARALLDFDEREIWLPRHEQARPDPELLRKRIALGEATM